ncbi:MAG TPA: DUF1684 domain-containing protein [Cyclobacteriaceae bacterium]|nr:DUF1684 domain-containing protein [Cyclobacteriaceae bacterium]
MGKVLALAVGCWLLITGCSVRDEKLAIETHKNQVELWHMKRLADLKSDDGWLNLAGLFWLNPGINSFGTDESNDVVFPGGKIDAKAGYFMVEGNMVTQILNDKKSIIFHPDSTRAIKQSYGSLEWTVIRRADKIGIRLRDLESENLKTFKGIDRFPTDYNWKIEAKFEPAKKGEKINITNVLGQVTAQDLAGTYVFEVEGTEQRLSATREGDELFIVFADQTNGKETYPAGRFLYTGLPDSTTNVGIIDFNKSYNPPCAFTDFATCPLPPGENGLTVAITAGEKNYTHHEK